MRDLRDRYNAIQETVQQASFPLTNSVVRSLAKLSGTELVVMEGAGIVAASTLSKEFDVAELMAGMTPPDSTQESDEVAFVRVAGEGYIALAFERVGIDSSSSPKRIVIVLFDKDRIDIFSRRAAMLPLVTGLSTIVLLSTLTIFSAGRLASRLSMLQRSVERVADGDFESTVADESIDELGLLGRAVDRMSAQLRKLWLEVNRQQGEKLLHQISAGMAHQLRNTLTGARLALELDQRNRSESAGDEVTVALRELETAEDYVRRLLLVGAGEQQQRDQPALIVHCLKDIRSSQAVIAKHLHVDLSWQWDISLDGAVVADGSTFSSAIANLVLNSLQVAKRVEVSATLDDHNNCRVTVVDDGPGIDPALADRLFDPFVTSKPEGMGLGLPLVRRAAEKLSGEVEWSRDKDRTRFVFTCQVAFPKSGLENVIANAR